MRCSVETVASLLVLLSGVVFSFGPLLFRSTSGDATAWQYVFWRFVGLAAVASVGLCWLCRARARPRPRWRDLGGGLMMSACNVCFIVALERVDAATVLLLQSLAPWSAALLAWAILREAVDRHTGTTMVLATAGVAIMGTEWGTADAIGLGAAITIALLLGSYAVVIRASPRHKDEARAVTLPEPPSLAMAAAVGKAEVAATATLDTRSDALEAVECALLLAGCTALWGLMFASVACAAAPPHTVIIDSKDAFLGITAGGLCLGVGLPLYSAAGKYIPAARTNLLLLSEILLAPTWTWLVAEEEYGARTLVGGTLLLVALAWLAVNPSSDGGDEQGELRQQQRPQQGQHEEDTAVGDANALAQNQP